MMRFGSREVLQILDVKPHVLRYWEQVLPLVRSQRDESGHRVWTAAQVRILQRLRHLVIRRGMNVQAAGDTILREAESAPGNVKAGLEGLRSELVATLQRLHAAGATYRSASAESAAIGRKAKPQPRWIGEGAHSTKKTTGLGNAGDGHVVAGASASLVESVSAVVDPVDAGFTPAPRFTVPSAHPDVPRRTAALFPVTRRIRPTDAGVGADPNADGRSIASKKVTCAATSECVRIVYRHLFAYSGRDASVSRVVPEVLRQILSMRTGSSATPIIVCAPADRLTEFRTAFNSWSGPELTVAPVPRIGYHGGNWVSPLLSVVVALSADPSWQRRISSLGAECAYLWAADSPDAPVNFAPPKTMLADSGIVMTVHPSASHTLIGESLVLRLGDSELYDRVLSSGHWSVGAVSGDPQSAGTRPSAEEFCHPADNVRQGWRYDLRLRDLGTLQPLWCTVPRSARPSLWRGYDWQSQIPVVWPELGIRE